MPPVEIETKIMIGPSQSSTDDEFSGYSAYPASNTSSDSFSPINIVSDNRVFGGDACIAGTRVPVWVLQRFRQNGINDNQLLEMYPFLDQSDLNGAWKYVDNNRDMIDQRITEDEG